MCICDDPADLPGAATCRVNSILGRGGAVVLSGMLALAILEGGVRLLERVGVIRTTGETFAEGSYQSETRKSHNRVLAWELAPESAALNSDGFRDREYDEVKPPGARRIVVLGHSVAYGHGVPMEQGFTELRERRLDSEDQPSEVLNFGVGGYNTRQQAEHYAVHANRFEHDIVLVAYVSETHGETRSWRAVEVGLERIAEQARAERSRSWC